MNRVAEFLVAYGPRDVLLMPELSIGARNVFCRADRLIATHRRSDHAISLDSEHPADVLAALVAGERLRRRVVLYVDAAPLPAGDEFEVILRTSGTSGEPKLVRHRLDTLLPPGNAFSDARWLLTYRSSAFAGLQVLLTALRTATPVVVSQGSSIDSLFSAAVACAPSHISGTPTFWRHWLMARPAIVVPLQQITLGGEIADQVTLDRLALQHPTAKISHVYASTEVGSVFAVNDGRSGFPARWLDSAEMRVQLRIRDAVLEVLSGRRMCGYWNEASGRSEGWLSTNDLVEVVGDRVLFRGRRDSVINVGGAKVAPEKVEAVLLAVDGVADVHVYGIKSVATGQVVVADILCDDSRHPPEVVAAVETHARRVLPKAEVPVCVQVVSHLVASAFRKKTRQ